MAREADSSDQYLSSPGSLSLLKPSTISVMLSSSRVTIRLKRSMLLEELSASSTTLHGRRIAKYPLPNHALVMKLVVGVLQNMFGTQDFRTI
jgi:hypothetical protein